MRRSRPWTDKEAAYFKRRQNEEDRLAQEWIKKQLAAAPPLSREQREEIAKLLHLHPHKRSDS